MSELLSLEPVQVWVLAMWATALGGAMFAFAPRQEPAEALRGMLLGVWMCAWLMFWSWWHFG